MKPRPAPPSVVEELYGRALKAIQANEPVPMTELELGLMRHALNLVDDDGNPRWVFPLGDQLLVLGRPVRIVGDDELFGVRAQ